MWSSEVKETYTPVCAGAVLIGGVDVGCSRRAVVKEQWLTDRGIAVRWFCQDHAPKKRHKKPDSKRSKKG